MGNKIQAGQQMGRKILAGQLLSKMMGQLGREERQELVKRIVENLVASTEG